MKNKVDIRTDFVYTMSGGSDFNVFETQNRHISGKLEIWRRQTAADRKG